MKYTIDQRMQIMAITDADRLVGVEFKDYVFIAEGHYGAYIKKENLKVKIKNMKRSTDKAFKKGMTLDPEYLAANTLIANESSYYYRIPDNKDFAIKLYCQNGNTVWVNHTWIKWFGNNVKIRMSDAKSPVYITDLKDTPVGIILPISIKEAVHYA